MKIAKTQSSLLTDVVMSLVADSIFNLDMGKSAESFSKMNSKKVSQEYFLFLKHEIFPTRKTDSIVTSLIFRRMNRAGYHRNFWRKLNEARRHDRLATKQGRRSTAK